MRLGKRGYWVVLGIVLPIAVLALSFHNIQRWLQKDRFINTLTDIDNLELAITKLISDAGHSRLGDMFDSDAMLRQVEEYAKVSQVNSFDASTALYSSATVAMLRYGRNTFALSATDQNDKSLSCALKALDVDAVSKLGLSYMPKLTKDHWGNSYRIFPGPWPQEYGPVLFRVFNTSLLLTSETSGVYTDSLTVIDSNTGKHLQGLPASGQLDVYIWSFGLNRVSDQPLYDASHQYLPPARLHYRADTTPAFIGGGDDINNWDTDKSFMKFYY